MAYVQSRHDMTVVIPKLATGAVGLCRTTMSQAVTSEYMRCEAKMLKFKA